MSWSALALLCITAIAALFGQINIAIIALVAALVVSQAVNRLRTKKIVAVLNRRIASLSTGTNELAITLGNINTKLDGQTKAIKEVSSQQLRDNAEARAAYSQGQKSTGLLFREVKRVTSILSGVDPVLREQNERNTTTVLLALKATERDITNAIGRQADDS